MLDKNQDGKELNEQWLAKRNYSFPQLCNIQKVII